MGRLSRKISRHTYLQAFQKGGFRHPIYRGKIGRGFNHPLYRGKIRGGGFPFLKIGPMIRNLLPKGLLSKGIRKTLTTAGKHAMNVAKKQAMKAAISSAGDVIAGKKDIKRAIKENMGNLAKGSAKAFKDEFIKEATTGVKQKGGISYTTKRGKIRIIKRKKRTVFGD